MRSGWKVVFSLTTAACLASAARAQRRFELLGLSPSFWDLVDHEFWRVRQVTERFLSSTG